MDDPRLTAEGQAAGAGEPDSGCSQVLWHADRPEGPPVTAVLTSDGQDLFHLHIMFGTVAAQQLRFARSIDAVERAERLLVRLEETGYRRTRRDNRGQ
jgi:hypothetical protein